MPVLTSQQSNELANRFLALAQAIGDFRYNHWDKLTKAQHQKLATQHGSVLRCGEDMLALSTVLALDDVGEALFSIRSVTTGVQRSLKTLASVQKGIDIVTQVVALGAAIVGENPTGIGDAIKRLTAILKKEA